MKRTETAAGPPLRIFANVSGAIEVEGREGAILSVMV